MHQPLPSPPEYDTQTDTVPELWQFIVGLRSDDLIAELIQNEIDAGSTYTILAFEESRLVCSGNGDPVDEDGWTRLRFLRGAGDRAPRKQSLIGVKNHGLKACFSIGDDIYIRSNGQCAHQTLYKDGHGKPPHPGATRRPSPDPLAPTGRGTIIEVVYRRRAIKIRKGEPVTLPPCAPETIEWIFQAAVAEIPSRFVGTLRPDRRPEHTIEMRHHRLGSITFTFQTSRPIIRGNLTAYLRGCDAHSDNPSLRPASLRERAVLSTCSRPGGETRDIPDFYKAGKRLHIEVAWREGNYDKVIASEGRFRYPIAYAAAGPEARTGLGVHYSAPFISDVERHGLAEGAQKWNNALINACDILLVDAIKEFVIPKAGARSLDLLVDPVTRSENRTKKVLELCLTGRALPVVSPRGKATKGLSSRKSKSWSRCVVPVYTANPGRVAADLAAIAPPESCQIASGLHPFIITLLTTKFLPSYGKTHVLFDEHSALRRLASPTEGTMFPWPNISSWRKAVANPKLVANHLNVIWRAISTEATLTKRQAAAAALAPKGVVLPDATGKLHSIRDMKLGAEIPPDLPGVELPPLLHPALAKHPLFRVKEWHLSRFTFDDFLEEFANSEPSSETRKALFRWLCKSVNRIPAKSWSELRDLPIWPDNGSGEPRSIDTFCVPRNSAVEHILGSALKQPSHTVMKLAASLKKRRLSLRLRVCPTTEEIKAWLLPRVGELPVDRELTSAERSRLRSLEEELTTLCCDTKIAESVGKLADTIPALNQADRLAKTCELVRGDKEVAGLHLKAEHLLDRSDGGLDRLLRPLSNPTRDMVEAALRADPQNTEALIPRLKALASLTPGDRNADLGIGDVPCIPVHGSFSAPALLAFKGNEGNFWGEWRREISGKNLAQATQALYKRAGVLSAEPRTETSMAFFSWLASDPSLVERHLPQILRHFSHERGARSWWEMEETAPCLPVIGPDGLTIISYSAATARHAPCYVNDFPELGDALERGKVSVQFAVDRHKDVRSPITEILLDAGVKSLKLAADQPISVNGKAPREAPGWAMDVLSQFQSSRMAADLQKRLVALQIPSRLIHKRWHRNLESVKRIICADEVSAVYKLIRHRVPALVRQAFDLGTGTLWLADDGNESAMEDAFFEALAERVFVNDAPAYCAPALEKALRVNIKEAQRSAQAAASVQTSDDANPNEDENSPGEAPDAHYDWQPDPEKNIPSPGPLPTNSGNVRTPTGLGSNRSSRRAAVPDEKEQVQNLKERQYAWHCQFALAMQDPGSLAPKGSYVEHQENRKCLIDAHHPDAVDAGGARHAGNIVILSHLAHHQYGRHISRGQITDALRAGGRPRQLRFGSGKMSKLVDGFVIDVTLPATGEIVPLFFTKWHRDYWLLKA